MSEQDTIEAIELYREFFDRFPDQRNPSDINTEEKAFYLVLKGFKAIRLMQRARKEGYEFTKHSYWLGKAEQ